MIRGKESHEAELEFDAEFAETISDTHWRGQTMSLPNLLRLYQRLGAEAVAELDASADVGLAWLTGRSSRLKTPTGNGGAGIFSDGCITVLSSLAGFSIRSSD